MADQNSNQRVVAVVPAFDEERDIAGVLRQLSSYKGFDEVIIVDDGSVDATAQVAAAFPVRVIRTGANLGKGRAMQIGVEASNADVIFFCDADMRGLSHALLDDIVAPVLDGETDMVIAMRNWRMYYAGFILALIPILGGQRAVRRALWEKVPHRYKERFMIETALNFYARYWGDGYQYKVVPGLTQTIKERKYGLWRGLKARVRMSAEVILAQLQLQFAAVPADVRSGRIALANITAAMGGTVLGFFMLLAAYYGPVAFVRELYAEKLAVREDTPIVDLSFYLAANTSGDVIASLGVVIIIANIVFALLNLRKLRYLTYELSPVRRIG